MRISRGRRGDPKRFQSLERWTKRKKKPLKDGETDAPLNKILVDGSNPEGPPREVDAKAAKADGGLPGRPDEGAAPRRRKRRRMRRVFRLIFLTVLAVLVLAAGANLQILRIYLRELPAPQALERYRPMLISRLYSSDHVLIGEYVRQRRKLVAIDEVPENLVNAIIAREDKYYRSHFGLDPVGIARAFVENIKARRIKQGGSTLTQQLVKNLTNQRERALERKIKEALLALKVEREYSKQEIMEMYLNQIYCGHGCYGVGSAANLYFGKEVKDLSLNECAMLAGLIQRPERHSPFRNPERARVRRLSVLRRMKEDGYIAEAQFQQASAQSLRLANPTGRKTQKNLAPHFYEYVRLSLDEPEGKSGNARAALPPYPFETSAMRQIGHQKLYTDGLAVETTLNFELQQVAQQAVIRGLHRLEQIRRKHPSHWGEPPERVEIQTALEAGRVYNARIVRRRTAGTLEVELPELSGETGTHLVRVNPEETWLDDFGVLDPGYWLQVTAQRTVDGGWEFIPAEESHAQACLIALEADTGRILAMVGGYDFFEDHPGARIIFPVQAALQPGSCFKPMLFACALSRGLTPSDTVDELPLEYEFNKRVWRIENFESTAWNPELHGVTPLRRALVKSMNVASVHVWNELTRDNRYATVSRFVRENLGVHSPVRAERASALGVSEMYPIEMAAAFAALANGGRRVRPYAIERVTDHYDNTLARQLPSSEPILSDPKRSAQIASQMAFMMKEVLTDPEGTGYKTIQELYPGGFPYPVAGKTGTTNDCTDAWFGGFSPRIVTCVWVGFERKKSLGVQITGSRAALPIWAEFMEKAIPVYHASGEFEAEPSDPKEDFPIPAGMVFVEVCKKSGRLANAYCRQAGRAVSLPFIAGTEPKASCAYHGPANMEAFDAFVEDLIASHRGDRPEWF